MSAKAKRRDESLLMYSTTKGREKLTDIVESCMLDKSVIGLDRYGRIVSAVVPYEAVEMLAGLTEETDVEAIKKIQRAAKALIYEVNGPPEFLES